MTRSQQLALILFATGMMGLGVLALICGDFALGWQPVAVWVPGRTALAYGSGVLMLLTGAGLLSQTTAKVAARILFPYLIVWAMLKVPALVAAPQIEAVWLGIGELTVLLAGGWILFALSDVAERSLLRSIAGRRGVRMACLLFGVSLLPIGLSHLFYVKETASLVPAWLPFHVGWAYVTGLGQIACGLAMLFSIYPRVAAAAEATMVSLFGLLIWLPAIVAAPKTRLPWTAFLITWAFAAASWIVAAHVPSKIPAHGVPAGKDGAVIG